MIYGGGGSHLNQFFHPQFKNISFAVDSLDLEDQLVFNFTNTDSSGFGGTNLIYFKRDYPRSDNTISEYYKDLNAGSLEDDAYGIRTGNIKPFLDYYTAKRYFEVTVRPANGSTDLGTGSPTIEPYRSCILIAFCTDYPAIDNMNSQFGIALDNSPFFGSKDYQYSISMYESSNMSLFPDFVVDPIIRNYDSNSDHNMSDLESYTIGIGYRFPSSSSNWIDVFDSDVEDIFSAAVMHEFQMDIYTSASGGVSILDSCFIGVTAYDVTGQNLTSFAPCKVQVEFNFGKKEWKYPKTASLYK